MKIISIDAGGTKSVGRLIHNGDTVHKIVLGFGNILMGDKALKNIQEIIETLMVHDVEAIVIGMAGYNGYDNKAWLKCQLEGYCSKIYLMSDIELAYYHLVEDCGVLVLSGTGSVMLSRKKDFFIKAGGWGHLLGDEGSGYSIGLSGIRKMIEFDESHIDHPWIKEVLEFYGIDEVDDIKMLYSKPKSAIAKLSLMVSTSDYEFCKDIIKAEAEKLSKTLIRFMTVHELLPKTIALTGSVMNNQSYVKALSNRVKDYCDAEIMVDTSDHCLGGWHYIK